MKKLALLLLLIIFSKLCFGQPPSSDDVKNIVKDQMKPLADQVKSLQDLSNGMQEDVTKTKGDIADIFKQVNNLNIHQDRFLNALVQRKIDYINCASYFTAQSLNTLNAFKNNITLVDLQNIVLELNNPNNSKTGFSLSSVINTEVKELINKKMNSGEANKVTGFVDKLVNNPITTILRSSVPVINNVVNFISSISFGNKKISPDDLQKFIDKINTYLKYYQSLADNTHDFEVSFNEIKIKYAALEMLLTNYIIDRINIIYDCRLSQNVDHDLNYFYVQYFDEVPLKTHMDSIIANDKDYNTANRDKKLILPSTTSSQAQYLYDEIESLTSQYINAYQKFINDVKATLEMSKTLEGAKSLDIDKTKAELDQDFRNWSKSFLNNLNLVILKNKTKLLCQTF